VKRHLAPESFNWYATSAAEYAALAGVWIPPSRWAAQARGTKSSYCHGVSGDSRKLSLCFIAYRVHAEDSNHFVPFTALIRLPSKLLCESTRKIIHALLGLQHGVRLAS
jgi:hypothetical protein